MLFFSCFFSHFGVFSEIGVLGEKGFLKPLIENLAINRVASTKQAGTGMLENKLWNAFVARLVPNNSK